MGQGWSKEKAKTHGEVFTPPQVTFKMMMLSDVRDVLLDVERVLFDPFVGQGQFPATELVLRLFFNIERLDEVFALKALASLYGVDIQAESIDECRAHMLATICEAYEFFTGRPFTKVLEAAAIIRRNFIVGDSPEMLSAKAPSRQPTLF